MSRPAKLAYLQALAGFKGQLDGRGSTHSCDLSGAVPGRLTSTDILDQIRTDTGEVVDEEDYVAILAFYKEAYNKAAAKTVKEVEDV